jgi:hypothetical protein
MELRGMKSKDSAAMAGLIATIAGAGRIYFAHDYVLGAALIGVGLIIGIINYRRSRP